MAVLSWSPVMHDYTGQPLQAGNEVTSYKVYRCNSIGGDCGKSSAALLATLVVETPIPERYAYDVGPTEGRYFATAINLGGESANGPLAKLLHPAAPQAKLS